MNDGITAAEFERYQQWREMMLSSFEFGLSAQRVLLKAGMMEPKDKLFFTRDERREIKRLTERG